MRTSFLILALQVVTLVAGVAPALGVTVEIVASRDNTLYSTGTTSNGRGDAVFSGQTGPNGGPTVQRAVIYFDVNTEVPASSQITDASLTLHLVSAGGSGSQTLSLHRLLNDWGEGTSASSSGAGAPATQGDATWLHTFYDTDFWDNAGGDFSATVSASGAVGTTPAAYTWGPTSQLIDDVQSMLDDSSSNFGWLVLGNESALFTSRKFASHENDDQLLVPVLTVEYDPPTIPAVSTWGVAISLLASLSAASIVFIRREPV